MFSEFSIFIGILKLLSVEPDPIYTFTSNVWEWLSPTPSSYGVFACFLLIGVGEKGTSWSPNGYFSSCKLAWASCHMFQRHFYFLFCELYPSLVFLCIVRLILELLIHWGNYLSLFQLFSLFVSYDFVYGTSSYVDFHLICTCLNLPVFSWGVPSKVFLIPGWLKISSFLSLLFHFLHLNSWPIQNPFWRKKWGSV